MAEGAVVRPAGPEDVPAAARLAAELVRLHHGFDPARFMRIEPLEEGYAHFLRTQIGREDTVVLVATLDAVVVGYALAGLVGRDWMDLREACGMLHDLYVDPDARGKGIGRRLVEEAVARLTRLGAARIVLKTASANERARKLFEQLGFRPTMLEMMR